MIPYHLLILFEILDVSFWTMYPRIAKQERLIRCTTLIQGPPPETLIPTVQLIFSPMVYSLPHVVADHITPQSSSPYSDTI